MPSAIAIVGLACVYPDARTPVELWENLLAQRRAFRRLPPERLRSQDYWSADRTAPDCSYAAEAAVIEGYEFDRVAFRVAGSTFRAADLAHWLALDVAAKALVDAGFAEGRRLPRETTGVLLGNTLTGEFSRANSLRLRWPYVRRVLEAGLAKEGWQPEARHNLLVRLETEYKAPFPPVGEESLAGGLSNTIAGRICNQFDLKGGGYTVDGACASSLVAVANACTALAMGDLDLALAGGVDLSLDPFELVGFAKAGALAAEEMRVFDRRSEGFWPGEGCGLVVLMRHEDALAQGCRVYAVIRGWGISSDGSGGITRPEAEGQLQALRRAYRRAGFTPDSVEYFEGHGTGTAVGDATELEVLSRARREASPGAAPAALGSIKANIGHTKAAAGVAGLIKAAMAVHTQVLPPTTGCECPHQHLEGASPALRVLREPEIWPKGRALRAAVSAMGFGGINAHLVLESPAAERRQGLTVHERHLSRSPQDAELFLLTGATPLELTVQVNKLLAPASGLSRSELGDLAAQLARTLEKKPLRAAIVASSPAQLESRLRTLKSWLEAGVTDRMELAGGVCLGLGDRRPRVAFLFPGQGSPTYLDGGIWRRRFESVQELYERATLPVDGDSVSTRIMQPAVVTASMAGLQVLRQLGLEGEAAVGHSLGELTALHWAGVFDEVALLRIARVRGQAMAELGSRTGAMMAISAPCDQVQTMIGSGGPAIVGYNSPRQTVVAGEAAAIESLARNAAKAGWHTSRLPVSHAFHTPLVAASVPVLADQLVHEHFTAPNRKVISTITGAPLNVGEDLRWLLCRQVTSPVRFSSALKALLGEPILRGDDRKIDLFIEVGPGSVLTNLVQDTVPIPAVALDASGASLHGLLQALAAAFVLGVPWRPRVLFADRFTRPFALDRKPKFFVNPCELAPVGDVPEMPASKGQTRAPIEEPGLVSLKQNGCVPDGSRIAQPVIDLVRKRVAECAELPVSALQDDHRMLSDLHLNSITVGRLVSLVAKDLGLPRVTAPSEFANASVAELAVALEQLQRVGKAAPTQDKRKQPPGLDVWFKRFVVELEEAGLGSEAAASSQPAGKQARKKSDGDGLSVRNGKHTTGTWRTFSTGGHEFAARLCDRLAGHGSSGVLVWMSAKPEEADVKLLLEGAQAVMAMKHDPRFVVVQHGFGGGAFARTLHLENPSITTCVINVPPGMASALDWIVSEISGAAGYTEASYDADGRRRVPRLKLAPERPVNGPAQHGTPEYPIGRSDVLLVTGGGKGIAAECALALGRATGASLALLGRATPDADKELAENLARFAASGVRCSYFCADVTDARAVRDAVRMAREQLGPVTAVLHGAGRNIPQLIGALDEAGFRRTLAPKVQGLHNVLAALESDADDKAFAAAPLRLLVTFSSIIARAGFRGEADYATANEWLTALTEEFQASHPQCRCLALEWSVWSGVGMGERLGRIESLHEQGITPIPPDQGTRLFLEEMRQLAAERGSTAVVVCGRFGDLPTLKQHGSELPLRRFLERQRAYYPGVELVVDVDLSENADPYLSDHVLQKQRLFPAVMALEAMAQAAMALAESADWPSFERVELARPVTVPADSRATIRLAALQRGPDLVEVCLRAEETDFQVDHYRALCRFRGQQAEDAAAGRVTGLNGHSRPKVVADRLPLEPSTDLYGRLLFHQGRFQRLRGYSLLSAKECIAEIAPDNAERWFGPYFPGDLTLGAPGSRDAALHAIQACIPHQQILPTGIDRMVVRRIHKGVHRVQARERSREGNHFIYDLEITDESGEVIEVWEGLRLRAVQNLEKPDAWPACLLGPYLERRLEELAPDSHVSVALEFAEQSARKSASDAAIKKALRRPGQIWRRPDGKPLTTNGEGISAAHCLGFTFAVAGREGTACDAEAVVERPEAQWQDLLGKDRLKLAGRIVHETSEGADTAATRLWTAMECLKKAGRPPEAPMVWYSKARDGWVLLRSGKLIIATCPVTLRGKQSPLVVAIAFEAGAVNGAAAATLSQRPGVGDDAAFDRPDAVQNSAD